MAVLNINYPFCPNSTFLDKVLDILCDKVTGVTGIFKKGTRRQLKKIYKKMCSDINMPQYVIYPLQSSYLNTGLNKIDPTNLLKGNNICAGHDLPVWLNDPAAPCRIMVLSQDPRRSVVESLDDTIGISSPFGLHSRIWRSNLTKGFVHYAMLELINENKENGISVYYTDIYKLRKVEPAKTDTTNYFISYNDILCKEICLFQPTIIVTLGSDAKNALKEIKCPCLKQLNPKPKIVNLPHPNARYKEGKWGDLELKDDKAETKIAKIKELIKEKMQSNYSVN